MANPSMSTAPKQVVAAFQPPPKSPPAPRTRVRRRHRGLALSFILLVIAPLTLAAWYLAERATDQFEVQAAFTVRREDAVSPAEMLGGFAGVSRSSSRDTDILNEYITSPDMVRVLDAEFDLREHFAAPFEIDPVFAFDPRGTHEDLTDYWQRIMRVSYDPSTELISIRLRAFDPEQAHALAEAVLRHSRLMINELSAIARADITRQAEVELGEAERALASARTALTEFRADSQIVDPRADLQGQMGLISALQEQLAEEMIRIDLLRTQTHAEDPRLVAGEQRVAIIRSRIADERQKVGTGIETGDGETDYARLVGQHESLTVELEIAQASYAAARTALDAARAEARRQSRYIVAFIKPALPERATAPKPVLILSVLGAFLVLSWALIALVFYALRDRR